MTSKEANDAVDYGTKILKNRGCTDEQIEQFFNDVYECCLWCNDVDYIETMFRLLNSKLY